MRDRSTEHTTYGNLICERAVRRFDANVNVIADEMQVAIANQRARQKARLAKNLKTVTDPKHEPSAFGKLLHRIHHGRKTRECAGAKIIAVGKPSGNDDGVVGAEIRLPMPDEIDRLSDVL